MRVGSRGEYVMGTSEILSIGRDFQNSDQFRGCTFETAKLLCDEIERLSKELDDAREKAGRAEPARNCDRFQTTKQAKEAYFAEVRHVSAWDRWETERLVDWLLASSSETRG